MLTWQLVYTGLDGKDCVLTEVPADFVENGQRVRMTVTPADRKAAAVGTFFHAHSLRLRLVGHGLALSYRCRHPDIHLKPKQNLNWDQWVYFQLDDQEANRNVRVIAES